ncbi:MAG: hypothetical protein Q4P06_06025 [Actinomycetaceae bacterium]|nr:hypothetical protein [Actinomycetaceae bacterium]
MSEENIDTTGLYVCSARQCTEVARWAVVWSNPKIHFGREKTWLACDGHREFLEQFVALRQFPHRVIAVADLPAAQSPSPKAVDPASLTAAEREQRRRPSN